MEIFAAIITVLVVFFPTILAGMVLTRISNQLLFRISVIIVLMLILAATYVVITVVDAPDVLNFVLTSGLIGLTIYIATDAGIAYGKKHPKTTSTE